MHEQVLLYSDQLKNGQNAPRLGWVVAEHETPDGSRLVTVAVLGDPATDVPFHHRTCVEFLKEWPAMPPRPMEFCVPHVPTTRGAKLAPTHKR